MAFTIYGKGKAAPHGGANRSEFRLVSVNRRWGLIVFNLCAVRELGIKPGMRILFAHEDDTNTWYFAFGADDGTKNGSKLRYSRNLMRTQNKRVAEMILSKVDRDSATFNVSLYPLREGGREWWKILVKTPYRVM